MPDDLRQRYAEAIAAVLDKPNGMAYRGTLPEALLAVRDDELERLRAEVAEKSAEVDDKSRVGHSVSDAWMQRAAELETEVESLRGQVARSQERFEFAMSDGDEQMMQRIDLHSQVRVLTERAEKAEATVAHYDNTICWDTTCHGCAKTLDASIRETERAEKAEARYVSAERTIDRVIALAKDMRTWCSPHGVAVDYADRIAEALIGSNGSMKRGEAFFVLETVLETAAENARPKAESAPDA